MPASPGVAITREGNLDGLPAMIADLIEANLAEHPERTRLLRGSERRVRISAADLDSHVGLLLGRGGVRVSEMSEPRPHLWILTDSETLMELPNAPLMLGLPSVGDPLGRAVAGKLVRGNLKIRGMFRVVLLSRVQRLLSVA